MDDMAHRAEAQAYSTRLDHTLKELQKKVKEHEFELEKIRSRQGNDHLPESAAAQARLIESALKEVTDAEPDLPSAESLLPALLALRRTHQTIQESKAFLEAQKAKNDEEERVLEAAQASLKDQNLLSDALNERITTLREESAAKADLSPEDGARERVQKLKKQKTYYQKDASRLTKAVFHFMEHRLGPMLEAEELGGPVVGETMDIDSDDLAGGSNAQGKSKKAKERAKEHARRQRRIDEIWGTDEGTDVMLAALEMRELTQRLMHQLLEADDTSEAYVQLPRESAAARFLVRSKVAKFHPKDATRLRLLGFGTELEA